ncbi:MAG: class I SAM-dependent methyltransferase [Puniceicoccales bacterium]
MPETSSDRSPPSASVYDLFTIRPGSDLVSPLGKPSDFIDAPTLHNHFSKYQEVHHPAHFAQNDLFEIPGVEDREYYFPDSHKDYWLSGLTDYLRIREYLLRLDFDWDRPQSVFDFGCSSGRVLRHFASHAPQFNLTAADINSNHIEWIDQYIGQNVTAFQCMNLPHLPLEDQSMDLIYAFSVFTHIDEMETAWLLELKRLLRPGGIAWLSIQSEKTWQLLEDPNHFMFEHLKFNEHKLPGISIEPAFFAAGMPAHRYVFRFSGETIYNTCVFHHSDYLRKKWGNIFEVVEIIPAGHDWQDVVVLRKR